MGWERVSFFRTIEIEAQCTAAVTLAVYTDQPGDALVLRETKTLPAASGRRVYKFHLAGTTKGRLYRLELQSAGVVRLFGIRIFARQIGADWGWTGLEVEPTAQAWTEHPLSIESTPDAFTEHRLSIEPTADTFAEHVLPIQPTSETFSEFPLPVEPTSNDWTSHPLPVEPTADTFAEHMLPIEHTSDAFTEFSLPIDKSSPDWSAIAIPIPPTPDLPTWAPLAVTL